VRRSESQQMCTNVRGLHIPDGGLNMGLCSITRRALFLEPEEPEFEPKVY
jgi:hypothetical protein